MRFMCFVMFGLHAPKELKVSLQELEVSLKEPNILFQEPELSLQEPKCVTPRT